LRTAITSLYAAGGVPPRANMRQIETRRLNNVVATLDLYDYLLRGDKHDDIRLETGDVVYVPLHGTRVQVTGAVLRPAVYELKEGETLPDVLRAAGGFRANAAVDRLTIHRILPAARRKPGPVPRAALDVALAVAAPDEPRTSTRPAQSSSARAGDADPLGGVVIPSLPLDNGDSVVVDSVASLDSSLYVAINGMVNKPGRYPLLPARGRRRAGGGRPADGVARPPLQGQPRPRRRRLDLHSGLRADRARRGGGERPDERHLRRGSRPRLLSQRRGRGLIQGGQGAGVRAAAQREHPRRPQAAALLRDEQTSPRAGRDSDRPGARHDGSVGPGRDLRRHRPDRHRPDHHHRGLCHAALT